MSNFGWNYPPGVTGNEYQIAGPDYEEEVDGECPVCGNEFCLVEQRYRGESWVSCCHCNFEQDIDKGSKWDTDPRV